MNTADKKQDDIFELLGVFKKPKSDGNCDGGSFLEQTARQHLAHLDEYKRIRDGCDAEIAKIEEKRATANTLIDMTEALAKLIKVTNQPIAKAPVEVVECKNKIRKKRLNRVDGADMKIVRLFKSIDPSNPMEVRLSVKEMVAGLKKCRSYIGTYMFECRKRDCAPVITPDLNTPYPVYMLTPHAENYL